MRKSIYLPKSVVFVYLFLFCIYRYWLYPLMIVFEFHIRIFLRILCLYLIFSLIQLFAMQLA
uniref:TLC domain-containing protein n=1 Tax=Schistosoma curassoni TaxID=6186 RepID=A0A183KIJ8_9TREM